jgi:hypothetical protein
MQKSLCLIVIVLFYAGHSRAQGNQTPFYVAERLKTQYITVANDGSFSFSTTPADVDSICSLLKLFVPAQYQGTNGDVLTYLSFNPFFGKEALVYHDQVLGGSSVDATKPTSIISTSSGGVAANIINGVANLMIQRAKQELVGAFLSKLQNFFSQHSELDTLFPKTIALMPNLLNYSYSTLLKSLQTAFQSDLSNLPQNIGNITDTKDFQKLFADMPELTILVKSFPCIYNVINGKNNAAEALDDIANFAAWNTPTSDIYFLNFKAGIKFTDIISQSLRANKSLPTTSPSQSWIGLSDLKELISSNPMLTIYLGLIYEQVKDSGILYYSAPGKSDSLSHFIKSYSGDITTLGKKITDFVQIANTIDTAIGTITYKKQNHVSLTNDDYYNYINTVINLTEMGADLTKWGTSSAPVGKYLTAARDGDDIYRYIYQAQYDLAFSKLMDFLGDIMNIKADSAKNWLTVINTGSKRINADSLGDMSKKDWKKVDSLLKKNAGPPNVTAALIKLKSLRKVDSIQSVLKDLNKYGTLAAGLATAKTPDDVTAALENAILPVGSASIKKFSKFNMAIQSYLGVDLVLSTPTPNVPSVWTDKFGVIAPIGLSFSWPVFGHWSASAFLSIFDLGAVVAYQLKYDTTQSQAGSKTPVVQKSYQVNFGQIVCPGLFGVIGLPKYLPISVGGGWEYGPGLGKIKNSGTTVANNPQGRWAVFVAVDIPFFNIINNK